MFYKFLIEIRNRIFLILLTWFSVVIVSYLYKETLLFVFVKPSLNLFEKNSLYFIFTNLTEIFSTYLRLSYFLGNQIVLFFTFYHVLIFLTPGLYYFEYKNVTSLFSLSFLFWIISIIILNLMILPFSWQFFLSFQNSINHPTLNFYFEAKINEYFNFYTTIYYICSVNFQIFVLLFVFLDYIKGNLLLIKTFRKLIYFAFFLIATVITPPDIFSQLFIGLSTIIIYETIIISTILKINLFNVKF
jgi:sec-independent protein translocase protein TatC